MGTSTAWRPHGRQWKQPRDQLSHYVGAWMPGNTPKADAMAESQVHALHQALRDQPDAYGLREATVTAGNRLIETLEQLADEGNDLDSLPEETLLSRLADGVAGQGGSLTDAVVRRAVVWAAGEVIARRATPPIALGGSWLDDLFALFFRCLLAGIVGEFLAAAVNETHAAPEITNSKPYEEITTQVIELSLRHVPDPRREAARSVGTTPDGLALSLPTATRHLVPRATASVLGLLTEDGEEEV